MREHVSNELILKRNEDGSVEVWTQLALFTKEKGGRSLINKPLTTFSAEEWANSVAAMSKDGPNVTSRKTALTFHQGEVTP
jgi:hypothetical protein